MSGLGARHLSRCHSGPKGVRDGTDDTAAGDPKDEIPRGVRGVGGGAVDAVRGSPDPGDVRPGFPAPAGATKPVGWGLVDHRLEQLSNRRAPVGR